MRSIIQKAPPFHETGLFAIIFYEKIALSGRPSAEKVRPSIIIIIRIIGSQGEGDRF